MTITLDGTTGITTPSLSGPLNGTVGATTPATGAFTSVRATSLVSTGTSQTAGASQLALVQSGATSILVSYGAGVGSGNRGAYDFYQSDSAAGNIQIPLSISSAGAVSALTTFAAGTTIGVGGATPSTSGAGITFPATASLSTSANTLDDYEEGTWTPNQGVGLTVVGTFSSSGTYTKIGRLVFLTGQVAGTTSVAVSATNTITENLPFPNDATGTRPTGSAVAQNQSTTSNCLFTPSQNSSLAASSAIAATAVLSFSATYWTSS